MKQQVTNHEYLNTGGNCMVSSFQAYFPDENKTLFVIVNEEGGSLSTADFISADLEYSDDMIIENFNYFDVDENHQYFELYKYCLIEYTKKDCKHHDYKATVPYYMLTEEMQQQITPEYHEWHNEEIGGGFQTDGFTVFLDDSYEPKRTLHSMKTDVYAAIVCFRAAAERLDAVFTDDRYMEWLSDKYPFETRYDELVPEIVEWCNDMLKDVTIQD